MQTKPVDIGGKDVYFPAHRPHGRKFLPYAQVAELVDALASGASGRKVVEVRVFSWAPTPVAAIPPFVSRKVRPLRPSNTERWHTP